MLRSEFFARDRSSLLIYRAFPGGAGSKPLSKAAGALAPAQIGVRRRR